MTSPLPHAPLSFDALTFADLDRPAGPPDWLWDGYIAGGAVTLLTSQWKSGKTTLLSVLLAKMAAGGELAGRAVRAGRAVVLSEEHPSHWRMRHARLRYGPHVGLMCQPFLGRPTLDQWHALIDQLVAMRAAGGLDLFVVDTLATFLPAASENNAKCMLDAVLPLRRLTGSSVGVLALHHPSKGDPAAGQAARGSGALAGAVDVLIEMSWFGRLTDDDRRRKLLAFSRFPTTPARTIIELNADGTDYTPAADTEPEADEPAGASVLLGILAAAADGLSRPQILARWPQETPPPSESCLWRWLGRAERRQQVIRTGTGTKYDPFRYRVGRTAG